MNAENQNYPALRIGSYNVRKCIGTDRKRSPERILEVIAAMNVDVLVLQEADRRLGNRPTALPRLHIDKYCDLEPVALASNEVSLGFHGNAVLVRRGLAVTASRQLHLPYLEPRGATMTELDMPGGGLRIVGVHLGLLRRHRRTQLAAIARYLGRHRKMPTVVIGDFNEWSAHRGLETLPGDFEVVAPGLSYHSNRPMAALDRMAFNDGVALVAAGVFTAGAAGIASDHLPIWGEFVLTGGGPETRMREMAGTG